MAINSTSPVRAIRHSLGHDGLATDPYLPPELCQPHLIWMKLVTAVSPETQDLQGVEAPCQHKQNFS